MDDYFIEKIEWSSCSDPINAIDFSANLKALEELATVIEMLGLALYEPIRETFHNNIKDDYYTLSVYGTCIEFTTSDERIAPVPKQYINTLIPALILAHLDDPESVKQMYNDFFINKKEERTPLLNQ